MKHADTACQQSRSDVHYAKKKSQAHLGRSRLEFDLRLVALIAADELIQLLTPRVHLSDQRLPQHTLGENTRSQLRMRTKPSATRTSAARGARATNVAVKISTHSARVQIRKIQLCNPAVRQPAPRARRVRTQARWDVTHPTTEKRRFFAQLPWTSRFISACTSTMRAATALGSVSSLRMLLASRSNASSTALLPSASGVVASALLNGANARREARQVSLRASAEASRSPSARARAARTVQAGAPRRPRCCALRPRAALCACHPRAAHSPAPRARCSTAADASAANHGTLTAECYATTACASQLRCRSSARARVRCCQAAWRCGAAGGRAPAAGRHPVLHQAAAPPMRRTWRTWLRARCVCSTRSQALEFSSATQLQGRLQRARKVGRRWDAAWLHGGATLATYVSTEPAVPHIAHVVRRNKLFVRRRHRLGLFLLLAGP